MEGMKAYCINLLSRPDRLMEVLQEFERMSLTVEVFPAITDNNPIISFNLSQYACIKKGYDSGADCFAVFEDDCQFDGEWNAVEEAMADLPYGWVCCYLGCNLTTEGFVLPERVTPRLVRLRDAWMSQAIIYSHSGADYILSQFKPNEAIIFDEWMRKVMKEGNVYLLSPMICYQVPGFSDIWNTPCNYESVHHHGNFILSTL